MGQIAFENSDRVIVTSDNPRTENPQTIIDEILSGIQPENGEVRAKLSVLADRAEAITVAVTEAGEDDVVLIAGKGHEDYQIILDPQPLDPKRTRKVPFDDRKIAAHAINLRHKS
jgi:UDP-N-acetylmuramoyl-L-alanyl-D-glutamate--2,6-diaminopimelate ligase